jgi:hypothetical protein
MAKITNRAKMTIASVASSGTGAITLGSAVTGYQTFAASGVVDADVVSYVIEDGTSWEIGSGTYTASGTTLARTSILASSNSGSAITATTNGTVFIAFLASDLLLNSNVNAFTAQQNFTEATLTDGASIAWNMNTQQVAKVTLGGNRALANPTNLVAGGTYVLRVIQDATGSRTLSYGTAYKWASGVAPTLSTAASAVDILSFYSDGANLYGVAQVGFA